MRNPTDAEMYAREGLKAVRMTHFRRDEIMYALPPSPELLDSFFRCFIVSRGVFIPVLFID